MNSRALIPSRWRQGERLIAQYLQRHPDQRAALVAYRDSGPGSDKPVPAQIDEIIRKVEEEVYLEVLNVKEPNMELAKRRLEERFPNEPARSDSSYGEFERLKHDIDFFTNIAQGVLRAYEDFRQSVGLAPRILPFPKYMTWKSKGKRVPKTKITAPEKKDATTPAAAVGPQKVPAERAMGSQTGTSDQTSGNCEIPYSEDLVRDASIRKLWGDVQSALHH